MDEYELDGAHAEIERLAAAHQGKKPLYSDRFLSHQTAGTEHFGAPPDAQLTHEDILGAVRELAEQHGVSSARVRGLLMLTTVRAGIGHSPEEEAQALNQVALAMERGQDAVSDEAVLELSGRAGADTIGLEDQREAARDEAAVLGLTVTATQRDKFAKSGVAMDDGAFPVHDATHLAAAKSEYAKGNLAGHSKAEVRAHINKRATALGLPGLDDDDRDEVAATVGLTQETRGLQLAAGSGSRDSASAVLARHPELSHLFRAGKTSSRKHPRRSDRKVTTQTRAHSSDLDDDTQDTGQPAKGGKPHRRGAAAILADNPELFGTREAATGNFSTPPKSAAQRHLEETYALDGGRPQGRITR